MMKLQPFEQFMNASTHDQIKKLQYVVKIGGYSFFRRILEGLKQRIKLFTDDETDEIMQLLAKAQQCFPQPGRISPSWEHIWSELEQVVECKIKLLQSVSVGEREGHWQVLMDNPYTNQEVVCYPNLTFLEAAYLYGYFRPNLENNEYIQVQKIQSIMMEYGA